MWLSQCRAGQQIIVQRRSALDRCMLKSNLMGQLIMEQNGLRPSRGNLLRNGIQKHVSYLTCISSACKHRKASTQVLYQGASDELERRFVMEDHSPAGKRLTAHLRNDGPIASLIEHNLPMGLRYTLVVKSTRTEAAQRHPLRCVMISMSDSAYQRAGLAPDLSNSRTCSPVKGTRLVSEQIRRLRWAIRQAKFALRLYARTMPFCPCLRRCFGPAPNLFCMSMGGTGFWATFRHVFSTSGTAAEAASCMKGAIAREYRCWRAMPGIAISVLCMRCRCVDQRIASLCSLDSR
nr:hypothetical protein CFP56_09000 [Quercus suber]